MRTLARIALALAALAGGPTFAHPLAPSLVELRASPPGEGQLLLRTPLLRAPGGELGVDLREGCRLLGAEPTVRESNARVERWRIDCEDGDPVGALLAVEGLDASRTQALARVVFADGRVVRRLLDAEHPEMRIPAAASRTAVFVVGLCLLLRGWRRLLPAVTAFTLGHSLTLGLVVLGFARVPSALAELAIAGSVLLLACELARGREDPPGPLARHAFALPFAFGLLHGLGFAGALGEAGVPSREIPLALLCFNVGIELGQLLVVLAALVLGRALVAAGLPARLRALPAYAIGSLAAFWCFERGAAVF
jgi:hypothetical protein